MKINYHLGVLYCMHINFGHFHHFTSRLITKSSGIILCIKCAIALFGSNFCTPYLLDYNHEPPCADYDSTETMGEAPRDMLGEAPIDTNATQNTTNTTENSLLLPSDCSITMVTVGCCKVMTTITIVNATMETSTNFTCVGANREQSIAGLVEEDTVSLLVVGKEQHCSTCLSVCGALLLLVGGMLWLCVNVLLLSSGHAGCTAYQCVICLGIGKWSYLNVYNSLGLLDVPNT